MKDYCVSSSEKLTSASDTIPRVSCMTCAVKWSFGISAVGVRVTIVCFRYAFINILKKERFFVISVNIYLVPFCLLEQHPQIVNLSISLKEACKYKLRSDCDGLLLNPVKFKTLTTLGDRSFAAAAPQLWNSLPYSIRSSRSVASFKKTLKTFLFQKAFLWFYVLFNLVFSRFYAVFYDLSSLGNFYSFSVDIIVLLFLVGSCTFCMYTLCSLSVFCFLKIAILI